MAREERGWWASVAGHVEDFEIPIKAGSFSYCFPWDDGVIYSEPVLETK